MKQESYELKAYWRSREENDASCAARLGQLIGKLSIYDPVFSDWRRGATPIDETALTELFDDGRSHGDFSPDKLLPGVGFLLTIWSDKGNGNCTGMHIHAGAFGSSNPHSNSLEIQLTNFRAKTGQPWRASELRPVLSAVIDAWNVDEASIDCKSYFKFKRFLDIAGDHSRPQIYIPWEGWITYLPADRTKLVTAPDGVKVDRLDNGGALYSLCEEPFTTGNPKHMELAAALQSALKPIQTV